MGEGRRFVDCLEVGENRRGHNEVMMIEVALMGEWCQIASKGEASVTVSLEVTGVIDASGGRRQGLGDRLDRSDER